MIKTFTIMSQNANDILAITESKSMGVNSKIIHARISILKCYTNQWDFCGIECGGF